MRKAGKIVPKLKGGRPAKKKTAPFKTYKVAWEKDLEKLLQKTYKKPASDIVARFAEECDYDTDKSDLERGYIMMSAEVGMAIEAFEESRRAHTCAENSLDSILDSEDLTILTQKNNGAK
jgi:hypothetical protein